jgi:hypothetical protein
MKSSKLPALPLVLYSSDQLLMVAEELHNHAGQLAQRRHKGSQSAEPPLSPIAAATLKLLPAASQTDDAAIEVLRQQLEEMVTVAPAVTLVLAAPPGATLKQELVGWLRTNVHPSLLVSFHVNVEIAGGMVIRSINHVYDCSFRQGLLAHPERFSKVLERV